MANEHVKSTLVNASKLYLVYFGVYICLYALMDGFLTAVNIYITDNVIAEFGITVSDYFLVLTFASFGLLAVIVLQFLADIIGRKPAIIISFLGMGLSGVAMSLSQDLGQFTVAFFFAFMFYSSDVWVIILAEEAPNHLRASLILWVTVCSVLATFIGPIARAIFLKDPALGTAAAATWRMLPFLLIVAIPLALLGIRLKESAAYRARKNKLERWTKDQIIQTLTTPWKEGHGRKLLVYLITGCYLGLGFAIISVYDDFLSNFFATGTVTLIFIVMSFFVAGTYLSIGPISDKFGRKSLSYLLGLLTLGSLICVVIFTEGGILGSNNLIPVMLFSGLSFAGYWGFFGLNRIHCTETFPTEIRGSALGWRSLAFAVGVIGGSLIAYTLTQASILSLGTIYILFTSTVIIALFVIYKVLPETKGIAIVETVPVTTVGVESI